MKNKTLSYLLMLGLITQFIVVVSGVSAGFIGENAIDFVNAPSMVQEADMSQIAGYPDGYSVRNGFWTDLVNTELVSNTGDGVYVAVLDTGLLENWQTYFPYANIRDDLGIGFSHDITWDDSIGDISIGPLRSDRGFITDLASGHGTHVTSTITGFDVYGYYGIDGVAPDVNIIPVLVLDAWLIDSPYGPLTFSGGTDAMIASGILYVATLASQLDGPVIINMSLGGGYSPVIEAAIDYAISQGVILVASAGNNGYAGMGYPGALPQIISTANVGWTGTWVEGWSVDVAEDLRTTDAFGNNHQLYVSDSSSRPNNKLGQKNQDLDVAAPGSWIIGPYKSAFSTGEGFYFLSGTSMAAPHVSGMIALLLQSYPDLNQAQVEFILKAAARGNPLPADGSYDLSPAGELIFHSWNGGDYGAGFLTADSVFQAAFKYA